MDTNGVETDALGADVSSKVLALDIATIEKWIGKDIQVCLSLLTAIQSDPDLRRQMAIFLKGRFENAKNREDLQDKNQTKLEL